MASHLKGAGVRRDQIDKLTEIAINDACHASNPKAVTREDFKRIFEEAIG